MTVNGRNLGYKNPMEFANLAQRLVDQISRIPGVQSASVSATGVLTGMRRTNDALIESPEGPRSIGGVRVDQSSRSMLRTLGIPVIAGRGFDNGTVNGAPREVIVEPAIRARAHWGSKSGR